MKSKYLLVLLVAFILTGCGVFRNVRQTYYVTPIDGQSITTNQKPLMIQIVPTEKKFHIPFIYERRKWGYPYSINIVLESNKPIETEVMIHYIKLTADEEVLLNEEYSKPLILKCIKPYSTYEYYKLEHHQELGELLKFEQGKKVELEVTVEIPGVFGKKTIKMKGVGEESKDSTWLFLAYLSV